VKMRDWTIVYRLSGRGTVKRPAVLIDKLGTEVERFTHST
jgi:hypothetical protein